MNYWTKYILNKVIRLTPLYFQYRRKMFRPLNFDNTDVYRIIKDVPYYKKNGYSKNRMEEYPFLKKEDIIGKEDQFISGKVNKRFLLKIATSGTSGRSLNFFKTIKEVIREEVFIDHAFSLIGENLRVAVLRGNRPASGIYEYKYGHLLLSSYHLSKQNVKEYISLIKRHRINCLHVYPSTLLIFCKYANELLKEEKIELPAIRGILSSSEMFPVTVKETVMEVFPQATIVDLYGQNEHAAFALAVNKGYYNFFKGYSIVEFLDTGIKNGENSIKEIVGTNISNRAMPLVRYRTADYVEMDPDNNIVAIMGRSNDFVVDKRGVITPCIVILRKWTLENVVAFQYYQDKAGELIYRVKVNEKFSDIDKKNILDDFFSCFHERMDVKVQVVDDFDKTKSGKHIRTVQKLKLDIL